LLFSNFIFFIPFIKSPVFFISNISSYIINLFSKVFQFFLKISVVILELDNIFVFPRFFLLVVSFLLLFIKYSPHKKFLRIMRMLKCWNSLYTYINSNNIYIKIIIDTFGSQNHVKANQALPFQGYSWLQILRRVLPYSTHILSGLLKRIKGNKLDETRTRSQNHSAMLSLYVYAIRVFVNFGLLLCYHLFYFM
jgi:hypothetical protein